MTTTSSRPKPASTSSSINTQVTVIDAVCGAGKTMSAINSINEIYADAAFGDCDSPLLPRPTPPKFIFICPVLREVDRIIEACPMLCFVQPSKKAYGTKSRHLEQLIIAGENVASTHALFPLLSDKALAALKAHGYRLIIDEAVEAVEVYNGLNDGQLRYLQDQKMMTVAEDGRCYWLHDDKGGKLETRFEDVKRLANTGSLYLFEGHSLIWRLPREIIDVFLEVSVLCYLWEASTLCAYLQHEGVEVTILGIDPETRKIIPREEVDETWIKKKIRKKLALYEGPRNEIGAYRRKGAKGRGGQKFTKTWFDNTMTEGQRAEIVTTVDGFIRYNAKVKSDKVIWTTLLKYRQKLTGPRCANDSCWLSLNARATNEYADRECMIYLANRYPRPELERYLKATGVTMEVKMWALSEMIQWLWRGCIRDCGHIHSSPVMHAFVPAERMRNLLKAWLDSNTMAELRAKLDEL